MGVVGPAEVLAARLGPALGPVALGQQRQGVAAGCPQWAAAAGGALQRRRRQGRRLHLPQRQQPPEGW